MPSTRPRMYPVLAISTVVYFIPVLVIGLPVMFGMYVVFTGILNLLSLGWVVVSAGGIIVLAAAFFVGMWVAGKVATETVNRLFRTDKGRI